MDAFQIRGGRPLTGSVAVSGSKNAALPLMAAAILCDGPVRLRNVPRLLDVRTLARLLTGLGMRVERAADDSLELETLDNAATIANPRLVRRMRASFCVLGPLLARRGRGVVPLPGGCAIGDRPVDLHLHGLAALGAELRLRQGFVVATARRLRGAEIELSGPHGPTVTGTTNVMSAAALARGKTVLFGAAREPEIVELGRFLIARGARIEGLGTSMIEIRGVENLAGGEERVMPDRIEAATLLLAVACSGGDATVTGAIPAHLAAVLDALRETGAAVDVRSDGIRVQAASRPRRAQITAQPYPGLPTDVQAQFMALLAVGRGRSVVRDLVFPERFGHLAELARLGANVRRSSDGAIVDGVRRLHGATVTATDLRASAALVLAGLAAEGVTRVRDVGHLDRGYEGLEVKLRQLGARIERVGGWRLRERRSAWLRGESSPAGDALPVA